VMDCGWQTAALSVCSVISASSVLSPFLLFAIFPSPCPLSPSDATLTKTRGWPPALRSFDSPSSRPFDSSTF
jgi:hypothetical protein